MIKRVLLACVLLAAVASPAAAQRYRPAPKKPSIGLRAFGVIDITTMAATESFKATMGTAQMLGVGGGAEVDLSKRLFLRFALTRSTNDGTRVFVDNGTVFDLHIPMTVTMTPIEAGGGLRFPSRSRFTPYIGGAFISMAFSQVSDFAQSSENVNERYTGGAAFGGVDVAVWKGLFVGGEAQYRHVPVPDVSTSVMTAFGERDLGGFTARVLIGYGK